MYVAISVLIKQVVLCCTFPVVSCISVLCCSHIALCQSILSSSPQPSRIHDHESHDYHMIIYKMSDHRNLTSLHHFCKESTQLQVQQGEHSELHTYGVLSVHVCTVQLV